MSKNTGDDTEHTKLELIKNKLVAALSVAVEEQLSSMKGDFKKLSWNTPNAYVAENQDYNSAHLELARELLAKEWEEQALPFMAEAVRSGGFRGSDWFNVARAALAKLLAQQCMSEVHIDFPGIGVTGPLPVVDGTVSIPCETMNDLHRYSRTGYMPEAPECEPPEGYQVKQHFTGFWGFVFEDVISKEMWASRTRAVFMAWKHREARLLQLQQAASSSTTEDTFNWRELYRFQTAMRYMDNNPSMLKSKAFQMADDDMKRLTRGHEPKTLEPTPKG